MHRARGFFLAYPLVATILAGVMPAAQAAAVPSLYVVVVPGSDAAQAAQEAMRVELVRLTGSSAAANDPALAALIEAARQYVQLERTTTSGQVQVLFNEAALSAAIGAAGRSLWDANRPLLWILLPPQDPAAAAALGARLSAAAQQRGLPITVVSPGVAPGAAPAVGAPPPGIAATSAAAAAPSPVTGAAAVPNQSAPGPSLEAQDAQNALDVARRAGANAALVAQALPSDPSMLQWTLVAPSTTGQWSGGPELAIDNATDALASAARTLDQAPLAQYDVRVAGVTDLAGLVNVLAAAHAAPGVEQVAVTDVDGDALTLHLEARGSAAELEHVLTSGRLRPAGTANGSLEYRYIAGP